MLHHMRLPLFLVALGFLLLAGSARAGGAATVTLDTLPTEVRAGEELHLTFVVRQHGHNPVDEFAEVGLVKPYLSATSRTTRETLRVDAYKEEGAAVGHFAVDVTFPSDGVWAWEIRPEPFEMMNQFEPLTVLPALSTSTGTTTTQAATAGVAEQSSNPLQMGLRVAGVLVLVAAVVLALLARQRQRSAPALEPR